MLILRENPLDFVDSDFASPAGGGIELAVPESGSNFQWRILTAGYNAGGVPHDFQFFLAPLGPLTGPRIELVRSPAGGANSWSLCDIWLPRPNNTESWSLRFSTSGKTAIGFLSVSLELLEVLQ